MLSGMFFSLSLYLVLNTSSQRSAYVRILRTYYNYYRCFYYCDFERIIFKSSVYRYCSFVLVTYIQNMEEKEKIGVAIM